MYISIWLMIFTILIVTGSNNFDMNTARKPLSKYLIRYLKIYLLTSMTNSAWFDNEET